jgi:hypothetical protein
VKVPRNITGDPNDQPQQPTPKSAALSRRKLLTAMGSAATVLGLMPLARAERTVASSSFASQATNAAPGPIPGGFNARDAFGPRFPDRFFHLFLPGVGTEPSTIFNFQGKMAILNIHGTGTRTEMDPVTRAPLTVTPNLPFATDVRFMQGTYVGLDQQEHQGTFAFF